MFRCEESGHVLRFELCLSAIIMDERSAQGSIRGHCPVLLVMYVPSAHCVSVYFEI